MTGVGAVIGEPSVKAIGVIPARFESVRLPGKVLADIAGKPMLLRVFEAARACRDLDQVLIASDSAQVLAYCAAAGLPALATGPHPSGSDRVHEVLTRTDGAIYVNIQGDEPTLRPEQIALLVQCLRDGEAEVATLKVRISAEQARSPDVVKVVTDWAGRALYFSRHPIPYDRDGEGTAVWFKHIGIYAYRRRALETFHSLPPSPLERLEKLEQLRLLEHGMTIRVIETPDDTIGVDTLEDLEQVRAYFRQEGGTAV